MIELSKAQFKSLNPMFQGQLAQTIENALEDKGLPELGIPASRVFVDDANNPNIALIIKQDLHIYGNAESDECDSDLYNLVLNIISQDSENHLINLHSSEWEPKLEKLLDRHIKDRWNRYNFRLNKEAFSRYLGWREKIPDGYTIYAFDGSSDEFLEKHKKGRDFWSPESKRFGRVLLKGDEIVSECFSVFFFDKNMVEVGIETQELYRRRGFAYLTSAAFIEYCLSINLEPNWGCWHFKTDSIALAKKLGFEEIDNRRVLVLQKNEHCF